MQKALRKGEPKKRVNLRLEPVLVEALRRKAAQEGKGYQTLIRECLWRAVTRAG